MRKLLTVGIMLAALTVGAPATAQVSDTEYCVVDNEILSGGDCRDKFQELADASWEGLSSQQQKEITATGLQGIELDHYVIRVRDGMIQEDEPGWNCHIHGNKICGPTPTVEIELPRTS